MNAERWKYLKALAVTERSFHYSSAGPYRSSDALRASLRRDRRIGKSSSRQQKRASKTIRHWLAYQKLLDRAINPTQKETTA